MIKIYKYFIINYIKSSIYLFSLLLLATGSNVGCADNHNVIEIDYEKDLIPEGIAIYPETNTIFISSIYRDKIIAYDIKTGTTKDLINTGQYGYKHGLGLEIKNDLLFALSSENTAGKSSSLLLVYDLKKGRPMKQFVLRDTVSHFMNDLAVSDDLQVFITDTERSVVYKLDYPNGEINVFLEDDSIEYPNGIAISDDNELLFVDSWSEGIRIVDLKNAEIINSGYNGTKMKIAVDGLKYYNNNLYGIRNGDREKEKHGFFKIALNKSRSDIDSIIPLLINHPLMNIPTTFCINEDRAYILANSQLELLDQEKDSIRSAEKLTNTYLIEIKI